MISSYETSLMFTIFPVLFFIVFLTIVCIIIMALIRSVGQWNRNNQSPVLTVEARVVTKRAAVSGHHRHSDDIHANMHTASTSYYATFEFESGDRLELMMSGSEYGLLAEGDTGRLTFQGTRYQGFDRHKGGSLG